MYILFTYLLIYLLVRQCNLETVTHSQWSCWLFLSFCPRANEQLLVQLILNQMYSSVNCFLLIFSTITACWFRERPQWWTWCCDCMQVSFFMFSFIKLNYFGTDHHMTAVEWSGLFSSLFTLIWCLAFRSTPMSSKWSFIIPEHAYNNHCNYFSHRLSNVPVNMFLVLSFPAKTKPSLRASWRRDHTEL